MAGSNKYDVIVIGGGHNGLTNAAYLARAGKRVLVLERRHVLGGAAVTEEVFPGFKFSVCSYVVSLLRPEIIRYLDLPRHGLEILPIDGTFTPMPNGDYLWRVNDHGKTHREIARHSKLDAEAYDEFGKAMQAMCRFVKPILGMVPPDPATLDPRELMKLLFIGRRFQGLTSDDKYNQVQLMTMSAVDFLDQWFETDVLKATMSASGIIGTFLGVRSPGTAYVLLHHYMGEIDGAFRSWGFARGGTGAISDAIVSAAREAGAEIRTESPVARISIRSGRATGVVLTNGDELAADMVLSRGDAVLSCVEHDAPDTLARVTWDQHGDAFGDAVIDTIAEYAPNIREIIRDRQVLTPLDLERDFGLTEGNIFQGELTLEQLFFARPVPGWAQYNTPVRNLWMCGSATHPGGGIMGAPGRNAALRILGHRS